MERVESFHFDMDVLIKVSSEGTTPDLPISYTGDFQAPDCSKGSISVSLGFFTVEFQTITIGDTQYQTDPQTGEWEVSTDQDALFGDPGNLATVDISQLEDLTLAGLETLEREPVYRITWRARTGTADETAVETRVTHWVGVDDGLLRQVVTEGDVDVGAGVAGSLTAGEGTATTSITLKFSEFGKPVFIEPPALGP